MAALDDIKKIRSGDIEEEKRRDHFETIRMHGKGNSAISSLLEKYGDIDESEEYKTLKEALKSRMEQERASFIEKYSSGESSIDEEKFEKMLLEHLEVQIEAHEKRDKISAQKVQIKELQEKSQQVSKTHKPEH